MHNLFSPFYGVVCWSYSSPVCWLLNDPLKRMWWLCMQEKSSPETCYRWYLQSASVGRWLPLLRGADVDTLPSIVLQRKQWHFHLTVREYDLEITGQGSFYSVERELQSLCLLPLFPFIVDLLAFFTPWLCFLLNSSLDSNIVLFFFIFFFFFSSL